MKEGKVYFLMRADGLVKIGFTSDLKVRLRTLAKSHGPLEVIRLIHGDKHREKRLHHAFAAHNEYGEWFRSSSEMLKQIAELDEGTAIDVSKGDIEKRWLIGEAEMAAEAISLVERLIVIRRQRTGCKNEKAISLLCRDYQLRRWSLANLQMKRSTSVTAFTMKVLREALVSELLAHRDELLADVAAAEAGEPLPSLASAKGNSERAA